MLPREFVLCCQVLFYVAKIVCVVLPRFDYVAKIVCVVLQSFVLCCQDNLCCVAKIYFMLPSFVLCCQILFYVAKIVCVVLPRFDYVAKIVCVVLPRFVLCCQESLCYVAKFCFMLPR